MPILTCSECGKEFSKQPSQMRSSKNNNFCTRHCAVSFNNKHREVSQKRSKIEKWLESRIKNDFPGLVVEYNKNTTIGSELDIYIPSIKLAFEINGPQHYRPIFGEEIFQNTVRNDLLKKEACLKNKITLIEIDVSDLKSMKSFKLIETVELVLNGIKDRLKNI